MVFKVSRMKWNAAPGLSGNEHPIGELYSINGYLSSVSSNSECGIKSIENECGRW